ncbi:MAG: UDP-2,3-diacylglucosamine hydrolase [uncultured Campylobacterales bacterium]|uniref:UDP-2,3-diacylglucosamine hydrolase n=1 Tax=uncultured Campylobacterales bacterium TaxID=352960 RepID=A0A6S6SR22_9BACT|nr:MAG: UDP-2,3-diacylglucosamine hydrolase [uncultured Campylobacterales bacterium]
MNKNSIFVADAHSMGEDKFYEFLCDIDSTNLQCEEIYLLGDIFELLFGGIDYIIGQNSKSVELLNKISQNIKVVYFEGNHDFNLKKLFPLIEVIKIANQPQKYIYEKKIIYIAHGDNNLDFGYKLYTAIIRNRVVLKVLNFIDVLVKNKISKKLYKTVPHKARYEEIQNFKDIVDERVFNYADDKDYIIEGHYHQDKSYDYDGFKYINMPSFKTGGYKRIQDLIKVEL